MDTFSKSERSKIMRQVRSGGTGPEMWVRRALHAAGFRFRLHDDKLPGKPDVVLRRYKTAVFVNGCLWHWHGCPRSRMPATNTAYWRRKFDRTVKRDAQNVRAPAGVGVESRDALGV